MRQSSKRIPDGAEKTVRDIRRATRRRHSAEEKIRIVLEGLRGEVSIAEPCRTDELGASGLASMYPAFSRVRMSGNAHDLMTGGLRPAAIALGDDLIASA